MSEAHNAVLEEMKRRGITELHRIEGGYWVPLSVTEPPKPGQWSVSTVTIEAMCRKGLFTVMEHRRHYGSIIGSWRPKRIKLK